MNITIAKALKEKNRIAGKISTLQKQVETYNYFDEDEVKDFDSLELLTQLQVEWAHLIDLKSKIAKANVGIADKLVRLTEAKAELSFWNGFRSAGQARERYDKSMYIGDKYVSVEAFKISKITSKEIADHRERVQKLIEDLQDEIDDYNATTKI